MAQTIRTPQQAERAFAIRLRTTKNLTMLLVRDPSAVPLRWRPPSLRSDHWDPPLKISYCAIRSLTRGFFAVSSFPSNRTPYGNQLYSSPLVFLYLPVEKDRLLTSFGGVLSLLCWSWKGSRLVPLLPLRYIALSLRRRLGRALCNLSNSFSRYYYVLWRNFQISFIVVLLLPLREL